MVYEEDSGNGIPRGDSAGSGLKKALLLGDSIRMGYCPWTRAALKGVADVRFPEGNGRSTQFMLMELGGWRAVFDGASDLDAVVWNAGHWDVAHWNGDAASLTSEAEYARNVAAVTSRLRKYYPGARLVFATTTPMSPDGRIGGNPRSREEIRRYNAAAKAVLAPLGADVFDAYALCEGWPASSYRDYCHFTDEGFRKLGEAVAEFLRAGWAAGGSGPGGPA